MVFVHSDRMFEVTRVNMNGKAQSATIAVVDRTESVLDAVKTLFDNQQNWRTTTYNNGKAFLDSLPTGNPDCLIMDPHLPDISGVDIVRAVSRLNSATAIIILTARPESPETREIKNMGSFQVLLKPATAETLIEHVQSMLAQRRHGKQQKSLE